ncbi:DUF371 domain-containing protein [Halobaculum gomorrense]|uniref:DUF371 domain-containing protein n=1 Tax=Halobaculum gomorrense TaxID=43928 RepID=A0A1M5TSS2_9EURY|nr:DUF371 domain-containing protein [Halobaculum gomorrense]SHH53774.1 hypothetical protein SAMN05443636_2828 [Halobaculum gomorrense]
MSEDEAGAVDGAVREVTVHAAGHEHVSADHESTFEVTSDDWLTPTGDCILAVEADATPADVPRPFVEACRSREATIVAEFRAADATETVTGHGHPDLSYEGDRSMVGRTSDYVDGRTIMVDADTAAADFDRRLVTALERGAPLTVTLRVEPSP